MMEIQIYHAADGWRWRLKAANGRVMADGGEAYGTSYNARRAVRRLVGSGTVDVVTQRRSAK